MKKIKPYVSIDIESTGLGEDADIIEIGAVYDDGVTPIDQLPTFHTLVRYETFKYAELGAMAMNGKILQEIQEKIKNEQYVPNAREAILNLGQWLYQFTNDGKDRLTIAGKNAAGSDIPWLENNYDHYVGGHENITDLFSHRTLDVGSLFFDYFGENVSLSTINKLTGRADTVSHHALDDAFDVVYAIRHKLNMERYPTVG